MKMPLRFVIALAVAGLTAAAVGYATGFDTARLRALAGLPAQTPPDATHTKTATLQVPAVTVARAETVSLEDTIIVTGTLVAREEILVAPEVEGLRVVDLMVDVGDRVTRNQVLARLERTQLDAQMAQNTAAIARAEAVIAQARSQIAQAEAAASEAAAQLERAKPLRKSGFLSDTVYDQREAAQRTTTAQLAAARDGLKLAEASKLEAEAQRKEIVWRLGNAEVKAPRAGVVSRRTARIGALAAGAAEPMFRIIADGEIELEAGVIEPDMAKLKTGQMASVEVAGSGNVEGQIRLVAPEVDRTTRLGTVKLFLGDKPGLRVGAFGRGRIVTAKSRGVAVPTAAVLYGKDTASVQRVVGDKIETVAVKTGLSDGSRIEIVQGLAEGDLVVAKAGTFLRDKDVVRPVLPDAKVSEAR